ESFGTDGHRRLRRHKGRLPGSSYYVLFEPSVAISSPLICLPLGLLRTLSLSKWRLGSIRVNSCPFVVKSIRIDFTRSAASVHPSTPSRPGPAFRGCRGGRRGRGSSGWS